MGSKKTQVRRCGYRDCRKTLDEAKNANARFCNNRCRNYERNAELRAKKRCRACGKKLAKRSKVYCNGHLSKAAAYKRKSEAK